MRRVKAFCRAEPVLLIAGAAALLSMLWSPPSAAYLGYLDLRVLSLLFCLMAVVAALRQAGLFQKLAQVLLSRVRTVRSLGLVLVLLCFFSSMIITNDVALLTFVPLAILILNGSGQTRSLLFVVVLQTVAANLGSMLTPVGNPQNLYLYSYFAMEDAAFFAATAPVTAAGLLLVAAACLLLPPKPLSLQFEGKGEKLSPRRLLGPGALFLLCLLAVLRVLPYPAALACVVAGLFFWDRRVFAQVDYALLVTFVCFFILVGNLGQLEAVRAGLQRLLAGRELLLSALASQVISNVPAAVLLSAFTTNARALLLGVNIGGLGTLVASLASLISFQLYARAPGARMGRYLLVFTVVNGIGLVLLLGVGALLV